MTELALLDAEAFGTPVAAVPLSAGARRTRRQAEQIRAGIHPLATRDARLQLHPNAPRDATACDRGRPYTCGGCALRQGAGLNRSYPKCWWQPEPGAARPRITNGEGTDVRAWWPACTDFTAHQPATTDEPR